jgi:CubicO group peptidase (beta-lactamase class C family)
MTQMRLILTLALASALVAAPPIVKDAAKTGLDPARLAQIPVRLKAFVDKGQAAGMVTLVARHGQIAALDAVGYTDIETKQPIRTDAIFQLHSMTKPVVCMAIMMLAEEGRLALIDPVEKHLPEFRGQLVRVGDTLVKPSRPVTIRDLMTHTSGMMLNPPPGIGELHGALHKSLSDVALILSQQPLGFQPGTKWQYSNTGIATLARIIEIHSGMPYEKFLEAKIFAPLGMKDTFTYPPASTHHRMPTAYILKDGKPVKYTMDPLGEGAMKFRVGAKYPLPEGGLYSTASDLFLLYQMMLNKGQLNGVRILSKASVETMTAVQTGDLSSSPGYGYGLGWAVVKDNTGTLSLLSKGTYGHGGRYGTYCFIDPKRDMIGIFLIHREGGSDEKNAFVAIAAGAAVD